MPSQDVPSQVLNKCLKWGFSGKAWILRGSHCDKEEVVVAKAKISSTHTAASSAAVKVEGSKPGQKHVDPARPETDVGRPMTTTANDDDKIKVNSRLGAGKSGVVYGINSEKVLKVYHDSASGNVERKVYERLGSHPCIARLLEVCADGSLVIERGVPFRPICECTNNISIQTKVGWLLDAARGISQLHKKDIVYADVGCGNLVLVGDRIKLIDFEGCSIDGGEADSCYEWFSYRRSNPSVSRGTDIFAFGCLIYEVSTGKPPYSDLADRSEKHRVVQELYENEHFPDVDELPLGRLAQRCWYGTFGSMEDVIQGLDEFSSGPNR